MQILQSHEPAGFLNLSPKPSSPDVLAEDDLVKVDDAGGILGLGDASETRGKFSAGFTPVPGFAVSHATHLTTSGLLRTKHVSQSQPSEANNEARLAVETFAGLLSTLEAESLFGFTAEHFKHLSEALFCTMQVPQFHAPAAGLNLSPNPAEEARGALVVV